MQTEKSIQDQAPGPKSLDQVSHSKPHGKVYTVAQNLKNKIKNKMKKSFESTEADAKDDTGLFISLVSSNPDY